MTGATGPNGQTGAAGQAGRQAWPARRGATGSPGPTGPGGCDRRTGATGPNGVTGAIGAAGVKGATGPAGSAGQSGTGHEYSLSTNGGETWQILELTPPTGHYYVVNADGDVEVNGASHPVTCTLYFGSVAMQSVVVNSRPVARGHHPAGRRPPEKRSRSASPAPATATTTGSTAPPSAPTRSRA